MLVPKQNPNLLAYQGYFVVAINLTSSTTFGQVVQPLSVTPAPNRFEWLPIDFTNPVTKDWVGKPFIDL